jgi:uncharacterized protein YggE
MRPAWPAFAAILAACAASAPAQPADPAAAGTLLQIEAKGSVKARPDRMMVYAAVVTTGATAAEALDRNNMLAASLIDAVRKSGLRVGGLKTSQLTVDPRFAEPRRDDAPTRIMGYVARNQLDVEIAEVAQAGSLISLLFEAGANEIRGPVFGLRDPAPMRRAAERAAIAEARAEAQNYAAALGLKVARVVRVFDRNFRDTDDGSIVVTGSRVRPTPVEPGEISFETTVNVEFLLTPP